MERAIPGGLLGSFPLLGSLYQSERLHDIRIALKKLRYTAELSAEAGRCQWRNEIQTLKATQELLGRLHDLYFSGGDVRRTRH